MEVYIYEYKSSCIHPYTHSSTNTACILFVKKNINTIYYLLPGFPGSVLLCVMDGPIAHTGRLPERYLV